MIRWLAFAGAALVLIASWLAWKNEPSKPALVVDAPAEAQFYLRGVQYQSYNDQGNLLYRVNADEVLYFDDETIRMETVKVDYVGGSSGVWKFKSDSGLVPAQERNLLLSGDVVMDGLTPRGRAVRLNTPEIWVKPDSDMIETSARVKFQSEQATATAVGMTTDLSARQLNLLDDVRVRQNP